LFAGKGFGISRFSDHWEFDLEEILLVFFCVSLGLGFKFGALDIQIIGMHGLIEINN